MTQRFKGRAEVRRLPGIGGTGGSSPSGPGQLRGLGHAVKVEPSVQSRASLQKAGTERHFVLAPIHHRFVAGQGGFDVVVHVLGGTGRYQVQHVVSGQIGIFDDPTQAMSPEAAPGGNPQFKVTILEQ